METSVQFVEAPVLTALRSRVRELCAKYPDEYWRKVDSQKGYPVDFVNALTESGYLAAMIPEKYDGAGLGLLESSIILEEINRSGGNATAAHAQMYTMGTLLRHGSEEQKMRFLPRIASGELRLQAFGVTEPDCGSDTTKLKTKAVRKGDKYVINGQKVFISRVQHSDWMILLARTTPIDQVKKRSEGLSVFMVDLHHAIANGLTVRPIPTMMNHETNELFLQDVEVPVENLIGEEGKGFKYILDGMIAERTMVAGEAIGDGYWFVNRAVKYANERVVFDRPIGKNQGIAFPIAQAYAHVRAADLMRFDAAQKFDAGIPAGTEANLAKHLAAEASWEAADVAMQTLGGYGVAEEYDVERKFRETRLFRIAPLSTNLILSYIAEHVLGLPRSY
ncbi:MAG: acyl-CoA dehydrogenase family protein [Candidatus Korobacteraceae bacterium]|jgi:acyl-CoA dehydrogenase